MKTMKTFRALSRTKPYTRTEPYMCNFDFHCFICVSRLRKKAAVLSKATVNKNNYLVIRIFVLNMILSQINSNVYQYIDAF